MFWILAAFVLLAGAVLILPAGIEIESAGNKKRRRLILAGVRIPLPKKATSQTEAKKLRRPKEKSEDIPFWGRLLTEFDENDLRSAWISVRRLLRCARVRVHHLALTVATPDPALTGVVYGFACAGLSMFEVPRQIGVDADFTQTRPRADYRIELSARPIRALVEGLRALWLTVLRKPERRRIFLQIVRRRAKNV